MHEDEGVKFIVQNTSIIAMVIHSFFCINLYTIKSPKKGVRLVKTSFHLVKLQGVVAREYVAKFMYLVSSTRFYDGPLFCGVDCFLHSMIRSIMAGC